MAIKSIELGGRRAIPAQDTTAIERLSEWTERYEKHLRRTATVSLPDESRILMNELKEIVPDLPARSWINFDLFPFAYLFADVNCANIARRLYGSDMFPTRATSSECVDMRVEARSELFSCYIDMITPKDAESAKQRLTPPILGIADREGGERLAKILSMMSVVFDKGGFARWFARTSGATGAISFDMPASDDTDGSNDLSLGDVFHHRSNTTQAQLAEQYDIDVNDLFLMIEGPQMGEYVRLVASKSSGRTDARQLRVKVAYLAVVEGRSAQEIAEIENRDVSLIYRHLRGLISYLQSAKTQPDLFTPEGIQLAAEE